MFCHAPHAQGACSAARPGTRASFPVGVPGVLPASSLSASSAWVLPPCSCFVPSVPPPRCCGGTLFRAYRAGAGGRVGAGAVRAPDCAREAKDARLPSAHAAAFFEAPAAPLRRKAKGGPREPPLCSHTTTFFRRSSLPGGRNLKFSQIFANGHKDRRRQASTSLSRAASRRRRILPTGDFGISSTNT